MRSLAHATALCLCLVMVRSRSINFGFFGEVQPLTVACARGWFGSIDNDTTVSCYQQSSGGHVVSRLDEGSLDIAGKVPFAWE